MPETSALLPTLTKLARPKRRSRAREITAKPRAPLCELKARLPAGGKTGANDAFKEIRGSVLISPRQLGPIIRMSCEIQLLKGKEFTRAHRHTSTAIYHVVRGQGRTRVGEGHLEWKQGDTFVVPLWQSHAAILELASRIPAQLTVHAVPAKIVEGNIAIG